MTLDRRLFLAAAGAAAASPLVPALPAATTSAGPVLRSVKWGMIRVKADVMGKFRLMKELGYDGMELVSPLGRLDPKELLEARDATGLPIHGVVDMVHWRADHQLSSPDPASRERGRKALAQAVRDSHRLGGSSVLLVPGKVTKQATHEQVWERSTAEVRRCCPSARSSASTSSSRTCGTASATPPSRWPGTSTGSTPPGSGRTSTSGTT